MPNLWKYGYFRSNWGKYKQLEVMVVGFKDLVSKEKKVKEKSASTEFSNELSSEKSNPKASQPK